MLSVPCGTHQGNTWCSMWYASRQFHVICIKVTPCVPHAHGSDASCSMLYPAKRRLTFHMEHLDVMMCVPCGMHEGDTECAMWYTLRWCHAFHVVSIKAMPYFQCGTRAACGMRQSNALWNTWKWCLVFHVVCIKVMPHVLCGMHQSDAVCSRGCV